MRALRLGAEGKACVAWQTFLHGRGFYTGIIDGKFGPGVLRATEAFQESRGLDPDGVVGAQTYGHALLLGFPGVEDDGAGKDSPNWPPPPAFSSPSEAKRTEMFGRFAYTTRSNGDVDIIDGWESKNIVRVALPELARLVPRGVSFHRAAAPQLVGLVTAWAAAKLLDLVLTWDGSFVPRMIRGSATKLSNHAFGSAFDINCDWNGLGHVPACVGERGQVRSLVEIANAHGFYWGGHYKARPDGMHFEVAVLKGA